METLFVVVFPSENLFVNFLCFFALPVNLLKISKSFSNFTTKQRFYQGPRSLLWDANIKEVSHCVCQIGAWVVLTSNSRLRCVKREHSHVCPQIKTISKHREIPQISSEFMKNNVRQGALGFLA